MSADPFGPVTAVPNLTKPEQAHPVAMDRGDKDSCYLDFGRCREAGDAALLAWAKHWGPYVAETFRPQPAWR